MIALSKVGFNGYQSNGQLRIEEYRNYHPTSKPSSSSSFEFRYCNAKELSSSFAEAQESLMAGSLDDLQNVNVLVEGNDKSGNRKSINSNTTSITTTDNIIVVNMMQEAIKNPN